MGDRYELAHSIDRLRATLRKAERTLPLSQPVRSSHLYDEAIAQIDQLTAKYQRTVLEAANPHRPVR